MAHQIRKRTGNHQVEYQIYDHKRMYGASVGAIYFQRTLDGSCSKTRNTQDRSTTSVTVSNFMAAKTREDAQDKEDLLWHALFCRSTATDSMAQSTTWATDRDGRPVRGPDTYYFPRLDSVETILKKGANPNAMAGTNSIWTQLPEQNVRHLPKVA
jgi:hypothetical protein